jgi:hypothetical protein
MRCPVCRAELNQGPQCRRCKADLALLFSLQEQRDQAICRAYQCLTRGEWKTAEAIAGGVEALRRDAESQRLCAVVKLLKRDFARARQYYEEGNEFR